MSIGRLRPDCSPVAATTFQYAEKDDWRGDAKNSVSREDFRLGGDLSDKIAAWPGKTLAASGTLSYRMHFAIPEKIDVRASHEEEVPFAGMVRQSR
jgi:hypothetical protein